MFNPERYLLSKSGTKPGADVTHFRESIIFGAGRVRFLCALYLHSRTEYRVEDVSGRTDGKT